MRCAPRTEHSLQCSGTCAHAHACAAVTGWSRPGGRAKLLATQQVTACASTPVQVSEVRPHRASPGSSRSASASLGNCTCQRQLVSPAALGLHSTHACPPNILARAVSHSEDPHCSICSALTLFVRTWSAPLFACFPACRWSFARGLPGGDAGASACALRSAKTRILAR